MGPHPHPTLRAAGSRLPARTIRFLVLCGTVLTPMAVSAQTETIEYYALDAVGSVRVVFDQSGAVLRRHDYEPFGAPVNQPVTSSEEIYAGLFRDEAGLDYAQARMYQRSTGRFNAPDPIAAGLFEPQRWNRYAYALNSSLVYSDPADCWPSAGLTSSAQA